MTCFAYDDNDNSFLFHFLLKTAVIVEQVTRYVIQAHLSYNLWHAYGTMTYCAFESVCPLIVDKHLSQLKSAHAHESQEARMAIWWACASYKSGQMEMVG